MKSNAEDDLTIYKYALGFGVKIVYKSIIPGIAQD